MMKKQLILTLCLLGIVSGLQAQKSVSNPVTLQALRGVYVCEQPESLGNLYFWVAGENLVLEELWSKDDGSQSGTAWLCELENERLKAVKSCAVKAGQWDGIVNAEGYGEWNAVKDRFQEILPFIIKYDAKQKTLTVKRNVFTYDCDATKKVDFLKVKGMDVVYQAVEQMPQFPGGDAALRQWMHDTMRYPSEAQDNNIQGTVLVGFVVNKDGSVVEPEILKSAHPLLDKEALRMVSLMPKWEPGIQKGKPVRTRYQFPVRFYMK